MGKEIHFVGLKDKSKSVAFKSMGIKQVYEYQSHQRSKLHHQHNFPRTFRTRYPFYVMKSHKFRNFITITVIMHNPARLILKILVLYQPGGSSASDHFTCTKELICGKFSEFYTGILIIYMITIKMV